MIHKFEKAHDLAVLPKRADEGASGLDLFAVESALLYPGDWKLISTGVRWCGEKGYELQVRPRSGMALKFGITVLNSPGTVDSSYTGVIGVILVNHSNFPYTVNPGDRIAQAVITKVEMGESQWGVIKETTRGDGGFGSSGK